MATKDINYYESVVRYNEEMVKFAKKLAEEVNHPIPKAWCRGIARQHQEHADRHRKTLTRLQNQEKENDVSDEEQVVHRSSESGQFVTEEEAAEHPDTTEEEHVDIPRVTGDVHQPFAVPTTPSVATSAPDPAQAATPVDAGVETAEEKIAEDAENG